MSREQAPGDVLRPSEELFRLLVESVRDYAIFMLDPEGRIVTWNAGAERIKGYRASEIIGQHFSRFYPAEDVTAGKPSRELEVAAAEGRLEDEGWRIRQDGSRFWANVVITVLRDREGRLRGFVKVTRDLTERKRAEDEIRQLNADLERRVADRTRELVAANAQLAATSDGLRTLNEELAVTNEELQANGAQMEETLAELEATQEQLTTTNTELVIANANLRESEARFRAMADTAPVLIWVSGVDKGRTWFNRPWLAFTGRSMGQELGNAWTEGVHPDDLDRCLDTYVSAFDARRPFRMEYRLRRADGEYRWILDEGIPRFGPDAVFLGYIGSSIDITDRKQAEETLRWTVAQQRFLAEASHALATSLDLEATIKALSALITPRLADGYALDLLQEDGTLERVAVGGHDPARIEAARDIARAYPRRAEAEHHPAGRAIRTGKPVLLPELTDALIEAIAPDPGLREAIRRLGPRSYMVLPLLARGRVLGTLSLSINESARRFGEADVALAEDIAGRAALAVDNARLFRQAQQAIREALAATRARDAFLARASHELRTPLTSVLSVLRLFPRALAAKLKQAPEELVEIAMRNMERVLALTNDLLDASKLAATGGTLAVEEVALAAIVRNSVDTVHATAQDKEIAIRVEELPDVTLRANALKLEQVLVNLLANAVNFTRPNGEVTVRARLKCKELRLEVRDSGEGIAAEHLDRIFDPFVQVDERQRGRRGSGLGLAICRQIVTLHGGRIWAESEGLGRGSTFIVELPTFAGDTRAA